MMRYKKDLTKEEKDILNRKNRSIYNKVALWQSFKYIKPLRCQKVIDDKTGALCGTTLTPRMTRYKVVLDCPKCKHCQAYVPKKILETSLGVPKVLKDNKDKNINAVTVLMNKLDETSKNKS